MRLGGGHPGACGDIAQHHRPAIARQHVQEAKTHLDRMNTLTVACHSGNHELPSR